MESQMTGTLAIVLNLTPNDGTGEAVTRTVNLDVGTSRTAEQIKTSFTPIRTMLLGAYNKFFQPSGWRDSNETEDEYTTSAVKMRYRVSTTTDFEF